MFNFICIVMVLDKISWICDNESAEHLNSHHPQLPLEAHLKVWELMIVSTNNGSADNRRLNMAFRIIVVIIVLKTFESYRICNFEEALVISWHQTLLKEDDGVLVTIAHKAFILLTEFPLMRCIHLKEFFPGFLIKVRILVPDHLRIIDFPGEHKRIHQCPMISSNTMTGLGSQFDLILFDKSILFDHYKFVFVVLFAYYFFFFLEAHLIFYCVNFVLPLSLCNHLQHQLIPLLHRLYLNQSFPLVLQLLNI
jgi:hypothetical protein